MITEDAIQEAIAYCNGKVDPNRSDAILLAACYILQDHMSENAEKKFQNANTPGYSFAPPPTDTTDMTPAAPETVGEYGESDFLQAVKGKDPAAMWGIVDELMDTLKMVNERVYNGVMRKIR